MKLIRCSPQAFGLVQARVSKVSEFHLPERVTVVCLSVVGTPRSSSTAYYICPCYRILSAGYGIPACRLQLAQSNTVSLSHFPLVSRIFVQRVFISKLESAKTVRHHCRYVFFILHFFCLESALNCYVPTPIWRGQSWESVVVTKRL